MVIVGTAVITPGPGNLNTMRQAIERGNGPAIYCVFGNMAGLALLGAASGAGLMALLAASSVMWSLFQGAAISILVFLALQMILTADLKGPSRSVLSTRSAFSLFLEAMMISALNPKAAMFFLAVFPLYVDPEQPILLQVLFLSASCMAVSAVSHTIYIAMANWARTSLSSPHRLRTLRRVSGAVMLIIALALIKTMVL